MLLQTEDESYRQLLRNHAILVRESLPSLPHVYSRPYLSPHPAARPRRFDCYSFDIENRDEDEEGINGAADWLDQFIDLELSTCTYLTPSRIVISGLSQGGAVTCRTVVGTERTLGGAFMLSTYVPLRKKMPEVRINWPDVLVEVLLTWTSLLRRIAQNPPLLNDPNILGPRHTRPPGPLHPRPPLRQTTRPRPRNRVRPTRLPTS